VIAYACLEISVLIGKIVSAICRVRIEKPQRVNKVGQSAAAHSPHSYVVVDLLRVHIGYALLLIGRAFELPRRINNVAHGIVSAVLALRLIYSVHYNRRHSLHALHALAACLALYKPRQYLQVCHNSIFYAAPRRYVQKSAILGRVLCPRFSA